jgi:hypothetical protein
MRQEDRRQQNIGQDHGRILDRMTTKYWIGRISDRRFAKIA